MTVFNQKTHDTDVGGHGRQSRQMTEVFENQEFGSIRVLQEAGKTFFCASDVAKALGYVNPYAAVKRHCRGSLTKREGVVQKVNQYGDAGEQVVEISFITEGDVYRLIVHSKLPSAERFEHWVFDEVLPSIRKHGQKIKHVVKPKLGEHQPNNPKLVYTMDFQVTPHQLRHTYITNLIYASVDPKTVQYLAGHENSKVTMDIYAKVKYNKPAQLHGVINRAIDTSKKD